MDGNLVLGTEMDGSERGRGRKRPKSPRKLLVVIWDGLMVAQGLLASEDEQVRLRACHALSALATTYRNAYEAAETEKVVRAIEEQTIRGRVL